MKKYLLLISVFFCCLHLQAQQIAELEENKPYSYNGLEYGFTITNERNREVRGEEYERYEIELYVTNNSGCIKLFPLRQTGAVLGSGNDEQNMVASFTCKNATGKRLTSKGGKVEAQPWYAPVRLAADLGNNNAPLVQALIGYGIRAGQTLSRRIIVIVPKGERPRVNVRVVFIPDFN
jgi:hypothetical protein